MNIEIVPCLRDNYAYLIGGPGDAVAVVDPSEAGPVLGALAGRRVVAILATHHHYDHVDGIPELCDRFPQAAVYGHADELLSGHRIPRQTHGITDGGDFELRELGGLVGRALHIPGHTLTAVAYHFPLDGVLFTGDTLFGAGCGRLFEGTPAQMYQSLSRLMELPPQTRVYPGHEYTVKNLQFAMEVEPESAVVRARHATVSALRASGTPSVPFTLAAEAATNPFVRVAEPSVMSTAAGRPPVETQELNPVEVLARIRRWKDSY